MSNQESRNLRRQLGTDVYRILRTALAQGAVLDRQNGSHVMVVLPNGHTITFHPSLASKPRSLAALKVNLRSNGIEVS